MPEDDHALALPSSLEPWLGLGEVVVVGVRRTFPVSALNDLRAVLVELGSFLPVVAHYHESPRVLPSEL
jgi:hypothetical protein